MSRRHLEDALVAGALIENHLSPAFRFSRARFIKIMKPPHYETSTYNMDPDMLSVMGIQDPLDDGITPDFKKGTCCPCKNNCCCGCEQHGACAKKKDEFDELCAKYKQTCEPPEKQLDASEDDHAVHSVQFAGNGKDLIFGGANTSVSISIEDEEILRS